MAHTRSFLWRVAAFFFAVLLCACAFFLFFRYDEGEDVYLVYTAVFEVDAQIANAFSVGERLTDARGKEDAGEILKITREPALRENASGIYPHPARVLLAITLGGEGKRLSGEEKIGTLTPRAGEEIYLLGRGQLEGLCVKVGAV